MTAAIDSNKDVPSAQKKDANKNVSASVADSDQPKTQKKKANNDAPASVAESGQHKTPKKRYILFVGNLPYKATAEHIKKHFKTAGSISSVRLLTEKKTGKPRGFAFVEFADAESLQKGLQFHHSTFQKRIINVEMTAGGGGKGDRRRQRTLDKNERLQKERIQLHQIRMTGSNMIPVKKE